MPPSSLKSLATARVPGTSRRVDWDELDRRILRAVRISYLPPRRANDDH